MSLLGGPLTLSSLKAMILKAPTIVGATLTNPTITGASISTSTFTGGTVASAAVTDPTISDALFTDSPAFSKASGTALKIDTASPGYGWQDMLGTIGPRATGPTAPTFAAFLGGIYAYRFDRAGMQEAFVNFHFIHDYAPGTDVYVHAHWSTLTAPAGSTDWMFEAAYAKGYQQAAIEGTVGSGTTITTVASQTPTAALYHNIAETLLSTPGGLVSSSVNVSITAATPTLTSASALFSSSDIGRTVRVVGAGAAGADLDTTISAFTSSTQVTLATNAGTTVGALPNFRWRILDSNLLEVDGMIMVRCWNDKTRTSDTLTVDPWLLFCDCHYQTTSLGTKQRNGPGAAFYT